jgi:hypothetical protein
MLIPVKRSELTKMLKPELNGKELLLTPDLPVFLCKNKDRNKLLLGKQTVQRYEANMLAFQLVFSGIIVCKDEAYSDPKRWKTKVQLALDSNSNHLADDATKWVHLPTLNEADTTAVSVVNADKGDVNAAATAATVDGTIQCNTN